ncbi:hypothetical protein GCM10027168_48750 [Streptomyces capparidis]
MALSARPSSAASARQPFSVRRTALWCGAAAVAVCALGIGAGVAGGVAREHPVATLLCGLVLLVLVAGARRGRPARPAAARRGPGARRTPDGADFAALEPREFEYAVAALCERDGCADVEVVGGAGDLGADVVATTPDGRRVVIQCKCYHDPNKVGSQDVQRFGGTCYAVHDAHVAAVVTTGEFTEPAAEYAEQCGIVCFDHDGLAGWAAGTAPAPWAAAR